MFNIHEIADDYDVFVAFETMNNRGKKLTNLELLKNRLIYLTNEEIDGASVKSIEKEGETKVYDLNKLYSLDKYDVFLSGAAALLTVENPLAESKKEDCGSLKQIASLLLLADIADKDSADCLKNGGANGFSTFMSYYILKAVASFDRETAIGMMKE